MHVKRLLQHKFDTFQSNKISTFCTLCENITALTCIFCIVVNLNLTKFTGYVSVRDFAGIWNRFVSFAYPDGPDQFAYQLRVSRFIDGVSNIQLQQALRLGSLAEMKDALVYKLEIKQQNPSFASNIFV